MLFRKELALLLLLMVSQVLCTLNVKLIRCDTCGHGVEALQAQRTDKRDYSEWCTVCPDPRMKVGESLELDAPATFEDHCEKCSRKTKHARSANAGHPTWWKCSNCNTWLRAYGA